jgi:molybdopterin synthase catalytic subunit
MLNSKNQEAAMDITQTIKQLKQEPGFSDNVGMLLVHNGVVRAWSRGDRQVVTSVDVSPDFERIEELRKEYQNREGIFRVIVEAEQGTLKPGDDLLFIVVAGDIRENVKAALSELLDRIKSEAVIKTEHKA